MLPTELTCLDVFCIKLNGKVQCSTKGIQTEKTPGCVAQSVTCLTADPGVVSLIPAWSHTFEEIDHEIISTLVLLLPLIQEGLVSVTSESMCTKKWLTA